MWSNSQQEWHWETWREYSLYPLQSWENISSNIFWHNNSFDVAFVERSPTLRIGSFYMDVFI